jgi:hypothetical protein
MEKLASSARAAENHSDKPDKSSGLDVPAETESTTTNEVPRDDTRRTGPMSEVDGCLLILGFAFVLSAVVAFNSMAIEFLASLLLGVQIMKGRFLLFAAALLMALLELWAWDRCRRGRRSDR